MNQKIKYTLSSDYKQEIELFFFHLFNGTYRTYGDFFQERDYRSLLKLNPSKLVDITNVFLRHLKNKNKDESRKIISQILSDELEIKESYSFGESTPERCLECLIFKISHLDKKDFEELLHNGSDIQVAIYIWGNNILVNSKNEVINSKYALERSMAYLHYIFNGLKPEKSFQSWELIHST